MDINNFSSFSGSALADGPVYDNGLTLADLAGLPRWCTWRKESRKRDGSNPAKVPYGVQYRRAKSNNPATWLTLARVPVVAYHITGAGTNLGVWLGPLGDGRVLCGIDLDLCMGPDGVPLPWGMDILTTMPGAYCEVSPSGRGLKLYVLVREGDLAAVRTAAGFATGADGRQWKQTVPQGEKAAGIEVYVARRWFAVTTPPGALVTAHIGVVGAAEWTSLATVAQRHFGGKRTARHAAGDAPPGEPVTFGPVGDAETAQLDAVLRGSPKLAALWVDAAGARDRWLGADKSDSTLMFVLAGGLRAAGIGHDWDGERQFARAWAKGSDKKMNQIGTVDFTVPAGVNDPVVPLIPAVTIRPGIDMVVDDAEDAVEQSTHPHTDIYQSGGRLVRPYHITTLSFDKKPTRQAQLDELTTNSALDVLAKSAPWQKWSAQNKGMVPCDPTKEIADVWLSRRGFWKARTLRGILTCPTVRPDMSVISTPGYDPATQLYLDLADDFRMPNSGWDGDCLTEQDARDALKLIDDLLVDFPFISEADRSVARSGIITPVIKGALDKRMLHAYDASNAGTGKTYLIEVSTAIALGKSPPVSSFSMKNEGENESRVQALLLSGTPIGVIDNVNGVLGGDLLCQACTSQTIAIRMFHTQRNIIVDNNLCLYANGNNLTIVGDLVRRSMVSRLDAKMERPEQRVFRKKPLDMVLANRGIYLAAVITIVRAHARAGYPGSQNLQASDFLDWNKRVRGALLWLGCADPLDTTERTYAEDPGRVGLRSFMEAWLACFGGKPMSARSAVDLCGAEDAGLLFRAVALEIAEKNDKVDSSKLGYWLRSHQREVVDGHRFIAHSGNPAKWQVVKV